MKDIKDCLNVLSKGDIVIVKPGEKTRRHFGAVSACCQGYNRKYEFDGFQLDNNAALTSETVDTVYVRNPKTGCCNERWSLHIDDVIGVPGKESDDWYKYFSHKLSKRS